MKLKYHIEKKDEGLIVLQSDPQYRNIFVQSSSHYLIRVPFPYIQFVIRYVKKKSGVLVFPGVYGTGLRVFGTLKSLETDQDDVFLLPTDDYQGGYVCTDHHYDNKEYSSVKELVNDVINLWWGTQHRVMNIKIPEWVDTKLEDIDKLKFISPSKNRIPNNESYLKYYPCFKEGKDNTFKKSLLEGKLSWGGSPDVKLPNQLVFVNLDWPLQCD